MNELASSEDVLFDMDMSAAILHNRGWLLQRMLPSSLGLKEHMLSALNKDGSASHSNMLFPYGISSHANCLLNLMGEAQPMANLNVAASKYIQRRAPVCGEELTGSERKASYIARRLPALEPSQTSEREGPRLRPYTSRRLPRRSLHVMDFDSAAAGSHRSSVFGHGKCLTLTIAELAPEGQSRPAKSQAAAEAVLLNIYDLGDSTTIRRLNVMLKPLGGGAFHAAIQVYGREWSFGGMGSEDDDGEESGIWSCSPQKCRQHTFRESISLGTTMLSEIEVLKLLTEICEEWPMNSYDLLRRNCCHFCEEFCGLLGVGHLPEWVLNLASAGAVVDDSIAGITQKVGLAMSAVKKLKGHLQMEKPLQKLREVSGPSPVRGVAHCKIL